MNLSEDCVIRKCLEMNLPTLANFMQTCEPDHHIVALNVYNYKKYKEEQYPILLGTYEKKQTIVNLLKNVRCFHDKLAILTGGTRKHKFKVEYIHIFDTRYQKRYSEEYGLYYTNTDFENIMKVVDPNIELERLRCLIFN